MGNDLQSVDEIQASKHPRTWSTLRVVFVLKARSSWQKLKRHEWKRLRGFTVQVLFNQTNKQTLKRHEWKRLKGFTVRVLFNKTNKQTNKQNANKQNARQGGSSRQKIRIFLTLLGSNNKVFLNGENQNMWVY